jgi:hypothetical protein
MFGRRARKGRDIPWQQAALLAGAALFVQAVNVIVFSGTVQVVLTVAIAVAMLIFLRILMVREYQRFPSGRDRPG